MVDFILWAVLALLFIALAVVSIYLRSDLRIWKTKKDFDFDELDKLLHAQEYKYEVSKYLHKYKSDRRSYENRIARMVIALIILMVLILADGSVLVLRHFL
jgi:uncharacterized membrane protein YecN with MAPEG domain